MNDSSRNATCRKCGRRLAEGDSFCPACGTRRRTEPRRPPAGQASPALRWLPFVFAAGAVFWLIELTQFAAVLAAPAGRDELRQALAGAGMTANLDTLLVVEAAIVSFFELAAVVLHAGAYFGLRRMSAWGWVAGVIVSGAWSLVIVGIPVFVFLLRRTTREAYGVS